MEELEDDHKRSRTGRAVRIVLLALAAGAVAFGLLRPSEPDDPGGAAPGFELPYLDGSGTLSSDELEGTPVVLNLWASWCVPCREEAPALEAMWQKYKDRVVILGVNVRDDEDAARKFARDFGLTYPLVHAEDRSLERALGSAVLPETYFIDHTWHFIRISQSGASPAGAGGGNAYFGGIDEAQIEAGIVALLARMDEAAAGETE